MLPKPRFIRFGRPKPLDWQNQPGNDPEITKVCCTKINMMRYTVWYQLYNVKNVKNTHGGVLHLPLQIVQLKTGSDNTGRVVQKL